MNILKTLAQKAKYRLRAISSCEDEEKKYSEACLSARGQYAIIASQKKVEDDPIYSKVKKMLTKNIDTSAPLSQLIDSSFDSLDLSKKEKYLFNLSKRYTSIKNHFETTDALEVV